MSLSQPRRWCSFQCSAHRDELSVPFDQEPQRRVELVVARHEREPLFDAHCDVKCASQPLRVVEQRFTRRRRRRRTLATRRRRATQARPTSASSTRHMRRMSRSCTNPARCYQCVERHVFRNTVASIARRRARARAPRGARASVSVAASLVATDDIVRSGERAHTRPRAALLGHAAVGDRPAALRPSTSARETSELPKAARLLASTQIEHPARRPRLCSPDLRHAPRVPSSQSPHRLAA